MPSAGAALLMEQGTGKTLVALAVAGRGYLNGKIRRVLVVAPSSVVPVWPKEIAEYLDVPTQVQCLDKTGDKARATLATWKPDPSVLQVCVVNYEKTWRLEKELITWGADMVICDESQKIKGVSTKQSKTMRKIGKKTKYRMILTGTPVNNNPLDFWSQYAFLDDTIFGSTYTPFKARYATVKQLPNGGEIILAYKNLDELVTKAHSIAFRVTKAEALDLPEAVDQTLYCEIEDKAKAQYRMMAKQSVIELSGKVLAAPEVITRLLRLSQITGGWIDGEEVSRAKLNLLKDTLSDLLDAGKKAVVFFRFLDEGEAIRKELEKLKIGYSYIRGDVPMSQRGEEVERFQTDPGRKVFLAQIQTAGLGITLHAADTCIFYSYDYSYANHEQAKARISRIGQTQKCTYIHLVVKDTIDEKVLQVLQDKGDVARMVVDSWREWIN